jgi:hypothetical protein
VSACIGNAVDVRAKVAGRENERSSQPARSIRALNPARRFRSRMRYGSQLCHIRISLRRLDRPPPHRSVLKTAR